MHKFLNDWDNMLDNMRIDRRLLDDKFLETRFVEIIRKSEDLRTYVEHYDRQLSEHPDRSYRFLHDMIRKVIVEKRQRRNKDALLQEHAATRKRPPTTPAFTPNAPTGAGDAAVQSGGRRLQPKSGSDSGGSDSDSNSDARKNATPRVNLANVNYEDRCCIRHLWQKCTETVEDGGCKFGPHSKVAPEIVTRHSLYVNMVAEHGTPEEYKPKAKGKGKDKGKGKGKSKAAAPAVAEESDVEQTP